MAPKTLKFTFLAFAILILTTLVQGSPVIAKAMSPTGDTAALPLEFKGLVARNTSATGVANQGIMNCTPNNIIGMCQFRTDASYYTSLFTVHIFGWNCNAVSEQCQGNLGTPMACGSILPDVLTVWTDANIWVHPTYANYEGNWANNLRCENDDNNYGYSSCFADFPCQYT